MSTTKYRSNDGNLKITILQHSGDWIKQESSIDAKIFGWNTVEEQDICRVSIITSH